MSERKIQNTLIHLANYHLVKKNHLANASTSSPLLCSEEGKLRVQTGLMYLQKVLLTKQKKSSLSKSKR